ncbi:MAG: PAS domain-containing protein [Bradymonadia bacterium]
MSEQPHSALAAIEGQLRAILEASHEGLALISPDMKVVNTNARCIDLVAHMFGVRLSTGDSLDVLVRPNRWSNLSYAIQRALKGEQISYCRPGLCTPGSWLRLTLTPVKSGGEVQGLVVGLQDITEHRAAEQESMRRMALQRGLSSLSELALRAESVTYVCWKALEILRDSATGPLLCDLRLHESTLSSQMLRMSDDGLPMLHSHDETQLKLSESLMSLLSQPPEDDTPLRAAGPAWPAEWQGTCGHLVLIGNSGQQLGTLWVGYADGQTVDAAVVETVQSMCHLIASAFSRIKSLDALTESEQVLHDAQRAGQIGSYSFDLLTQSLKWTEETHRLFEMPSALGQPTVESYLSRCHPEDLPDLQQAWQGSLKTGKAFEIEHRIILPGGRLRWLQCTGRPVCSHDGEIVRLAGTALDITERKQTELELAAHRNRLAHLVEQRTTDLSVANEALRESQQFLERLTSNTPNTLLAYDLVTDQPIFVNARVEQMTGYAPVEIIAMGRDMMSRLIHPRDLEEAQVALSRIATSMPGETFQFEARINTRDGGQRWWRVFLTVLEHDASGQPTQALYTCQDVTAHKAAEQALMESEALLAESQTVAQVGSILYDYSKGIERMSPQALRIYGLNDPTRRYQTQHLTERILPDDLERLSEHVKEAARAQKSGYSMEYRIRRTDGAIRWIYGCGRFERGTSGMPERLFATVQDITERKEMEEKLRSALARQTELSELKTRFVSMVSHEFRTPLATIQGAAQMIDLYGHRLNAEATKKQLGTIQRNTREMTALLEDVLMLGRAESGNLRFNPSEMIVGDEIRSFIEEFSMGLETQHRIELREKERPIKARVDFTLFRHILGNLLTNAVKYSPDARQIDICVRKLHDPELGVDGGFSLEVTDHGIGIPEADLSRLFEPFHRAENVGTIRGTGLGLCVLHHAVEQHGGHIDVVSKVGHGTTFSVRLPLTPAMQPTFSPSNWGDRTFG